MSNTKEPKMEEVTTTQGGAEQVGNSVNVEEILKQQLAERIVYWKPTRNE